MRGVVASEMPSSWSPEALKAQAVAARTYAITSNVGGDGYGLYSDTRSQAYGGVAAETPSTDAAVAATRGQIVTYNGAPATTFFSSSSGGYTENIENVWLGSTPEPWLRGVSDPYDGAGGNPYHRWSYTLTLSAAARDLGSLVKGALVGIQMTKRGVSPRVVSAQVVGTKRSHKRHRSPAPGHLQPAVHVHDVLDDLGDAGVAPSSGGQAPRRTCLQRGPGRDRGARPAAARPPRNRVPGADGCAGSRSSAARAGGWRVVRHARLAAGGRYSVRLRRAGRYRLVYHGVPGPAITRSAEPSLGCAGDARSAARRRRSVPALPVVLRAARTRSRAPTVTR